MAARAVQGAFFRLALFLYLGIRVVAYKGACDRKIVIGHFVDDYADRRFRDFHGLTKSFGDFRHHGALLFQSAALFDVHYYDGHVFHLLHDIVKIQRLQVLF